MKRTRLRRGTRPSSTPSGRPALSRISGAARRGLAHNREPPLPPLPGSYATIPEADIDSFPHYGGKGCAAIGITPEDVRQGIQNVIPEGFNPLPATLPAYN